MEKGEDPLFSAISYPRDMVGKRERFPQRWGRERFSTRFPRGIHREMWEKVFSLFSSDVQGCFAVQRECFALRSDLLLPLAAKVGKNAIQTCGLKIRSRYGFLVVIPFTTRSQNMSHVVPYDELTFFLCRCCSCAATVEAEALFVVGISGSGAVAETVL